MDAMNAVTSAAVDATRPCEHGFRSVRECVACKQVGRGGGIDNTADGTEEAYAATRGYLSDPDLWRVQVRPNGTIVSEEALENAGYTERLINRTIDAMALAVNATLNGPTAAADASPQSPTADSE